MLSKQHISYTTVKKNTINEPQAISQLTLEDRFNCFTLKVCALTVEQTAGKVPALFAAGPGSLQAPAYLFPALT